jgi:dipeptidyl aminopeptidase/acylaminoacyl peptidase
MAFPMTKTPTISAYGSWPSPLPANLLAESSLRLGDVRTVGTRVYWLEGRPQEKGRGVVMTQLPGEQPQTCTPAEINVRTRVYEYGGAPYAVDSQHLFVCSDQDGRIYFAEHGQTFVPISPEGSFRYGDLHVCANSSWLMAVREDFSVAGKEPSSALVLLDWKVKASAVLTSGYDFYASPRVSPDGKQLAWLCWNHPNMPWDGCELWLADLSKQGTISNLKRIAGGEKESITQIEWSPGGLLYFVSDRHGYWNLFRTTAEGIQSLCPKNAEFGRPHWVFYQSSFAFESEYQLLCSYIEQGVGKLARLDLERGILEDLPVPFTDFNYLQMGDRGLVMLAASPTCPATVVVLNGKTLQTEMIQSSSAISLDQAYISQAQTIEFVSENGRTAHAFYYAPCNPEYQGNPGEKPPLLVKSHGGPTAATSNAFRLSIQYWTSRGFAVVDVNYGGSTGYGREYREQLNGSWGVVDVDDCLHAAKYLVDKGLADVQRLAISGGSAGGYTTLCALTFRDYFRAGASYYGIGDLEALHADTHKFESRYDERLIGPYSTSKELYHQRSPINFAEKLSCPVIFFQGLEDKVVPPAQSETMVNALKEKGIPVAYLAFEGEQHGFRHARNIQRAVETELTFYGKIFGFTPADPAEDFEIFNFNPNAH